MTGSENSRRICFKLWFSGGTDKENQICLIPHVFGVITNLEDDPTVREATARTLPKSRKSILEQIPCLMSSLLRTRLNFSQNPLLITFSRFFEISFWKEKIRKFKLEHSVGNTRKWLPG